MYSLINACLYWGLKALIIALAVMATACAPQVDYNRPGIVGPKGDPGIIGQPGERGSSCTVTQAIGGARVSCEDGTEVVVFNGNDGATGATGAAGQDAPPTAFTVTEIIDPCGHQTAFDEVLLRLANGQLIAHFASGANQFLTLIGPGSYITTDSSHCYFSVNAYGEVINEHN